MFSSVRHLPVFEGNGDIVKEAFTGPSDGFEGPADDTDIVKEEDRMIFVS